MEIHLIAGRGTCEIDALGRADLVKQKVCSILLPTEAFILYELRTA